MTMPRLRISIATVMILVVTAATLSALGSQVYRLLGRGGFDPYTLDTTGEFLVAIVLTAVALGARKSHSARQIMLQINLACLGFLSLIGAAELKTERLVIWWYQLAFALLVAVPLVVRRRSRRLERGPRRTWWLRTTEAIAFGFLNMHLVLAGAGIQIFVGGFLASTLFK